MNRIFPLSTCIFLAVVSAKSLAAPLIDVEAGGYIWSADYAGDIGITKTSLDDLALEESSSTTSYVVVEHAIPVLPNFKIASTQLDTQGTSNLSANFTLDNRTFSASTDVTTEVDASHTDFTVFYGLPELVLDIDLGLTFRVFDGEVKVTDTANASNTETFDLDLILPMGYASARFDVPGTGFFVDGEINAIGYDGNSVTDTVGRVGYSRSLVPAVLDVEVSLGYRSFKLDVTHDEANAEASASGPFANLSVIF